MPAPVPPKGKPAAGKAVPPKGKPNPTGKTTEGKAVPPKESPKDKMARLREMQNKKGK
jgi:hypothetical protein